MTVVLGLSCLGFAQDRFVNESEITDLHLALEKSLNFYDLRQLDGASWTKAIQQGETIEVDLLGQPVEIELQQHNLRAPNFRAVQVDENGVEIPIADTVSTYRGSVVGYPGSEVRLVITDRMITGTIQIEGEVFFFQPASKFSAKMGSDITVVYRDLDVQDQAKAFCGMKYHQEASKKLLDNVYLGTNPKVVQIALDMDGEFRQAHPTLSVQDLKDLLEGYVNQLDAIWRSDLDLQLEITAIYVRTNPATDPWDSTTYGHGPTRFGPLSGGDPCLVSADGLFEQFRTYWNSSPSTPTRDIFVLFVGRDMKLCPTSADPVERELFGSAGFLGTICRYPDRAYVIMEEYTINTAGLMAHEIGHSLNGEHVFISDCDPGLPIGPVLCGTVEAGSDYYSATNITKIGNFVAANDDCLGEELEFTSVADAYVIPEWPNNNYGSRNEVFIRTGTVYKRNGYVKFNVTGLTSTISSATLRIKIGPVTIPSAVIYPVADNSWGEFTITWNNAPSFGFSIASVGPLAANTWVDIDVTALISGNGIHTLGITAQQDTPNMYFRSRQSTDKPLLIIKTDD